MQTRATELAHSSEQVQSREVKADAATAASANNLFCGRWRRTLTRGLCVKENYDPFAGQPAEDVTELDNYPKAKECLPTKKISQKQKLKDSNCQTKDAGIAIFNHNRNLQQTSNLVVGLKEFQIKYSGLK